MQLVVQIYGVTSDFPSDERFGLTSQLRRAAVSVPSNIAEGSAQRTTAQFLRFLYTARSSLAEIDTQMEIADSLEYLRNRGQSADAQDTLDNLSRGLQALIDSLEKKR